MRQIPRQIFSEIRWVSRSFAVRSAHFANRNGADARNMPASLRQMAVGGDFERQAYHRSLKNEIAVCG